MFRIPVERPVLTTMVFLAVCLLGTIAWSRLSVELYPSVNYPQVSVITEYENSSAQDIENLVTIPLEEALNSIRGVKQIRSYSSRGVSRIILDFDFNTDLNYTVVQIREKIDACASRLPEDIPSSRISRFNPSDLPVIQIFVQGNDIADCLYVSKKIVKREIEKAAGVARVDIIGGPEKEYSVLLDPKKMQACSVDVRSVQNAIEEANYNFPAGEIVHNNYSLSVYTDGRFKKPEDIAETVISKDEKNGYIRVKELGIVRETLKEDRTLCRHNMRESVMLEVYRESGSNTTDVIAAVKNQIEIAAGNQAVENAGISIVAGHDQSEYISSAINNLVFSMLGGSFLAFIVLYIFLKSFIFSAIVLVSIPVSVIAVFNLMYSRGITLNMMSLGGLALGAGMLVDSSIVVIENIFSHFSRGDSLKDACIKGTAEVWGPLVSSTLTTIIVFLPVLYIRHVIGRIFADLAVTVSSALIVSLCVAVSLIPMLAAAFGRKEKQAENENIGFEALLGNVLKYRFVVIAGISVLFVLSGMLFTQIPGNLIPAQKSVRFSVTVSEKERLSLDELGRQLNEAEAVIQSVDGIIETVSVIDRTEEEQERIRIDVEGISADLKGKVSEKLSKIEGSLEFSTENTDIIAGQKEYPLKIRIISEDSLLNRSIAQKARKILFDNHVITSSVSTVKTEKNGFRFSVNRQKASLLGISASMISEAVAAATGGKTVTRMNEEDDVDIRVRIDPAKIQSVSDISSVCVVNPERAAIPLGELADINTDSSLATIFRHEMTRAAEINAEIGNMTVSEASALAEKLLDPLKNGVRIEVAGQTEEMKTAFSDLTFSFLLAVILVYLLLAGQFESFRLPFVIMFTVPLAFIGVVFFLMVFSIPASVMVYIGIIMLAGIVVNNGIILVDCAENIDSDSSVERAVKAAGRRFRPVVMTALTTITGLLPVALAAGDGSELRIPLAATVIGGMIASTFLTLFFLPALYSVISPVRRNGKTS